MNTDIFCVWPLGILDCEDIPFGCLTDTVYQYFRGCVRLIIGKNLWRELLDNILNYRINSGGFCEKDRDLLGASEVVKKGIDQLSWLSSSAARINRQKTLVISITRQAGPIFI